MIYDCFNFYNELDLLDIRLHELTDVVDRFVLVESTVTFTNQSKPLYYEENKTRFKAFEKKIIHIVVRDSPNVSLPWIIEHFQFAAVMRGLKNARPSDTILLSCVDELPKKEKILQWMGKKGRHKVFLLRVCQFFLNYAAHGKTSVWPCTSMLSYRDLRTYQDPYIARFSPIDVSISDGGWHFTFMGGIPMIQKKLTSWSHQEYNNDRFNTKEYLQKVIRNGRDVLGTALRFRREPLSFLPSYIQTHSSKFSHLILIDDFQRSPIVDWYLDAKRWLRVLVRLGRTRF